MPNLALFATSCRKPEAKDISLIAYAASHSELDRICLFFSPKFNKEQHLTQFNTIKSWQKNLGELGLLDADSPVKIDFIAVEKARSSPVAALLDTLKDSSVCTPGSSIVCLDHGADKRFANVAKYAAANIQVMHYSSEDLSERRPLQLPTPKSAGPRIVKHMASAQPQPPVTHLYRQAHADPANELSDQAHASKAVKAARTRKLKQA